MHPTGDDWFAFIQSVNTNAKLYKWAPKYYYPGQGPSWVVDIVMEDRKFAVLFAATILAARKLSELEAQGITRPCPARDIIITDAISKAEEIMRKIEKNYPLKS